jgi:integrase
VLLARNPFGVRTCKLPKEKNPRRRVMTEAQYQALLSVADELGWRFRLALVLANETGHRQSAIRLLRWSDVDLEEGLICWRAENEKTGYKHETPLSQIAQDALAAARSDSLGIGDAWVFPSPRWSDRPLSRNMLDRWLQEAQKRAPQRHTTRRSLRSRWLEGSQDDPNVLPDAGPKPHARVTCDPQTAG